MPGSCADLLRVDVEVDQGFRKGQPPAESLLFGEAGADGEHGVPLRQELLRQRVQDGGAGGELVVLRERSLAQHRREHRGLQGFGQLPQFGARAAGDHPASGPDDRGFGCTQGRRGRLDFGSPWLRSLDPDRPAGFRLTGGVEDVAGDLERRRARTAAAHAGEGLAQQPGDGGDRIGAPAPAGDRAEAGELVAALVQVALLPADAGGGDLAGDAEHRRGIAVSGAE